MEKSYVTHDTILETAKSEPRIIYIPNAVAGFIGDLIISLAKKKVSKTSGT